MKPPSEPIAYGKGSDAVRRLFGHTRKRAGLDYDTVLEELSAKNDNAAKAAKAMGAAGLLKARNRAGKSLTASPIGLLGLPNLMVLRDLVLRELPEKSK